MLLLSKLKARRVAAGFRVACALILVQARAKRSASDLPHGMDGKELGTLRTRCEHHDRTHTMASSIGRNFIMPRPWPSTVNLHSLCRSDLVDLHEVSRRSRSPVK